MIKTNSILDINTISDIVKQFVTGEQLELIRYKRYYEGDNASISDRPGKEFGRPDNRLKFSYARKLVKTIGSLLFKTGNIIYEGLNDDFINLFKDNDEPTVSFQLGRDVANYGIAFELFFIDDPLNPKFRFTNICPVECIPVYDYSLIPKLTAVIRLIKQGESDLVKVYDAFLIRTYQFIKDPSSSQMKLALLTEEVNLWGVVPFNVYQCSEDFENTYEHVLPLIDAYDVLFSDSQNEFCNFAMAYMKTKGFTLSPEQIIKLKDFGIFELKEGDDVSFLTKDIPVDFIRFMSESLKKEIHCLSHIPDFNQTTGSGILSGEAIDRLLFDAEIVLGEIESYFVKSLQNRIKILETLPVKTGLKPNNGVKIIMKRNRPKSQVEDMNLFNGYANGISQETRIKNFATFVDDPKKEIDATKIAPIVPNNQTVIPPMA